MDEAARECSGNKLTKYKNKSVKRQWPDNIKQLSKDSKHKFWLWKQAGRPRDTDNQLFIDMKTAKKALRSGQRQNEAVARNHKYTKIMSARENDDKLFYKLISEQRKDGHTNTNHLVVDNQHLTSPNEIREGWATYFEELATPEITNVSDDKYDRQVEIDRLVMEDIAMRSNNPDIVINTTEVSETIESLRNGKAADNMNISSEHLKYGGQHLHIILTFLINMIFQLCTLPESFRLATATPVYKRKGKPTYEPNSYRKIAVASTLGKIVEKLHLSRSEKPILQKQNPLQRGFTRGCSPSNATVIVTELIADAKDNKKPLSIAFLDAQKAFDVLDHNSLIRKINQTSIGNRLWMLINEWYKDLTCCVKWEGDNSRTFKESQGIRQGGVWSPSAYKIYINPLLQSMKLQGLGSYIGSIYCGTPTVADDICLASNDIHELQTMMSVQEKYANREHYKISSTKSSVVHFGQPSDNIEIQINGATVSKSDSATHLGVTRDNTSKFSTSTVAEERIASARRTSYSLMGAGLHGLNGLCPTVTIHMIRIFIIPRLIYGLESIRINTKDIDNIISYFKRLLKQIQHLPKTTSDAATYLVLGQLPINAEVDKRTMCAFGNIVRNKNTVEYELAFRQLAMKSTSSGSWFIHVANLLKRYGLPSPHDLLNDIPTKYIWKQLVKNAVTSFWEHQLKQQARQQSSLKYLNIEKLEIGTPQLTWSTCGNEPMSVTRAMIKMKLLLGVYMLQTTRHKFNQYEVKPDCPLCSNGNEDRTHFIATCQALEPTRTKFLLALRTVLESVIQQSVVDTILTEPENITQLILDCTLLSEIPVSIQASIESISRGLCYALHLHRSRILRRN